MNDGNLIKGTTNLPNEDVILLREKFISEYSKKRGWDKSNLTPNQLLEITQQPGYKTPGLILG